MHLLQRHGQPVPGGRTTSGGSLRRAQGRLGAVAGPRRSLIGQHPHRGAARGGRLCESDEKLSDDRVGEPSNLLLKNRRHPGAGGGGARAAALPLRRPQRVAIQRRYGTSRGAGSLSGGRRRTELAPRGHAAAPHECAEPTRTLMVRRILKLARTMADPSNPQGRPDGGDSVSVGVSGLRTADSHLDIHFSRVIRTDPQA
jgi:hypothetical protein